jgi:hypothetical protein
VSWNGSTEVAEWELLTGTDEASLAPVERVPKDGFETAVTIPDGAAAVAVRALDARGAPLGTSRAVVPDAVADGG